MARIGDDQFTNAFDQAASAMEIKNFVILSKDTKKQLSEGTFKTSDGTLLRAKEFTRKDLELNPEKMAAKIAKASREGRLGGIDEEGILHLHENLAKSLNKTVVIIVTNRPDGEERAEEVSVTGIDGRLYNIGLSVLQALQTIGEKPDVKAKENKSEIAERNEPILLHKRNVSIEKPHLDKQERRVQTSEATNVMQSNSSKKRRNSEREAEQRKELHRDLLKKEIKDWEISQEEIKKGLKKHP